MLLGHSGMQGHEHATEHTFWSQGYKVVARLTVSVYHLSRGLSGLLGLYHLQQRTVNLPLLYI